MLEALWESVRSALALDDDVSDVSVLAMALRTIVVYGFALAIVRLANKRFLSRATAFDVIVAIMLGSIVSRAINGSAPFVATLVGSGVVLVAMHGAFALLSFHTDWFGTFVKGEPVLLVRDGEIQPQGMQDASLSRRDLDEHLRLQGHPPDVSRIQLAYLERSGQISVVARPSETRVLEVSVEGSVQTIRIEIG